MCPYMAGGCSRRGSPKAGTTVPPEEESAQTNLNRGIDMV